MYMNIDNNDNQFSLDVTKLMNEDKKDINEPNNI
jgi:hypothetical protein